MALRRTWKLDARKRRCTPLSSRMVTSNVKYLLMFLMIMTRKGSLMPSVCFSSAGHAMYVVLTLEPATSSTDDWMSVSVMRLM